MQRAVAIVVALIVIAGVAVLVLNLSDSGVGSAPEASVTPEPSAEASAAASEEASPSAAPSADEEEVLAELAAIEDQMVQIRGLPAAEIGPPDIITRAELGEELQAIFDAEYPPEERERDNFVLRALGLLEPDQDVAELQLELLGDQVLGFYDDVEKRMVVVTDAGLNAEAKLTYAHEYTHALQDAAFGLDSLQTDAVGEDDRSLARTALIEGDATMAMLAWAFAGNLTQEELLELGGTPIPDTSGIPSWMVAQLEFPYTAGQLWVADMTGFSPTAPIDFSEVDAAYGDPPDSTEQVIHFAEAWDPREEPDQVEVPDIVGALGDGWEEVETTTIGEAIIGMTLEYLEVPSTDASRAAGGWGGDRAVVASGPDDAFAVAWVLTWDTPTDADEFVAAYETGVESLDFPATVQALPGGTVLVVHGSTQEIVDGVLATAG